MRMSCLIATLNPTTEITSPAKLIQSPTLIVTGSSALIIERGRATVVLFLCDTTFCAGRALRARAVPLSSAIATSRQPDGPCSDPVFARSLGQPLGLYAAHSTARKCGAQYSAEAQQRHLAAASQHDRQHTELAGTTTKRPAAPLVRDEEAAGSNPATPTTKWQVTGIPWPALYVTPLPMSVFTRLQSWPERAALVFARCRRAGAAARAAGARCGLSQWTNSVSPPLERTGARRCPRSRSSTSSARISLAGSGLV